MIRVFLAALIAWACLVTPTVAGDWRWVSASDTETVGVDFASIRTGPSLYGRSATTKLVWTVWVPKRELPRGTRDWDYRVQRLTIDCSAETIVTGNTIYYAMTSTTPTDSTSNLSAASPIVPDTMGSALANAICGEMPTPGDGLSTAGEFARLQLMSDEELGEYVREMIDIDLAAADAVAAAAAADAALEGGITYRRAPPCRNAAELCDPWERLWTDAIPLPPGATVTRDGWIVPATPDR